MYTKAKSADMRIWYDRDEFAFIMDSESVIEGDLDRQINIMKDIYLEQLLQLPDIPPEWALMINDVLLPTDISSENLGMTLEYSFDEENIKLNFAIEGLGFIPPTTEAFLTLLDKALAGGSLPGFSLVFEGGSDEERFVEIEVPPTTSEPVIEEPRKVVWIVDNLANLKLVTVKAPLKPAEFVVSDLTITPEEVEEGETVTVSVDVTNIGEEEGTCTVDLILDREFVISEETPPLWGGDILKIRFEIRVDMGIHEVEVEGLTGIFTVVKPEPPFWNRPELVMGVFVVIIGVIAILWRRGVFARARE